MAIFSNKEEEAKKDTPVADVPAVVEKKEARKADSTSKKVTKHVKDGGANLTKAPVRILKSPRITEKAAYMTINHAYVFEVAQDATKRDVVAAVKALYDVTPVKVNIVVKQPRAYVARFRNRRGTKSGMKKAYVFLKKDEKIDLA